MPFISPTEELAMERGEQRVIIRLLNRRFGEIESSLIDTIRTLDIDQLALWVWLWVRREEPGRWAQISAGLLVGGALGNVIDRVIYGAVADFLNMSCCGIENPYAFNVADISIFAGAIGLILFTGGSKNDKAAKGGPTKGKTP